MPSHLKAQDVLVALKMVALHDRGWTYTQLAEELGLSASEAHAAVKRLLHARLARSSGPERVSRPPARPVAAAIEEFLVHGLKYAFPPDVGTSARGMPTAHAAPPLNSLIADAGPPPVWPDPNGTTLGIALEPLYRTVPVAAQRDSRLYELLALTDALRAGRARERDLARRELSQRLGRVAA